MFFSLQLTSDVKFGCIGIIMVVVLVNHRCLMIAIDLNLYDTAANSIFHGNIQMSIFCNHVSLCVVKRDICIITVVILTSYGAFSSCPICYRTCTSSDVCVFTFMIYAIVIFICKRFTTIVRVVSCAGEYRGLTIIRCCIREHHAVALSKVTNTEVRQAAIVRRWT